MMNKAQNTNKQLKRKLEQPEQQQGVKKQKVELKKVKVTGLIRGVERGGILKSINNGSYVFSDRVLVCDDVKETDYVIFSSKVVKKKIFTIDLIHAIVCEISNPRGIKFINESDLKSKFFTSKETKFVIDKDLEVAKIRDITDDDMDVKTKKIIDFIIENLDMFNIESYDDEKDLTYKEFLNILKSRIKIENNVKNIIINEKKNEKFIYDMEEDDESNYSEESNKEEIKKFERQEVIEKLEIKNCHNCDESKCVIECIECKKGFCLNCMSYANNKICKICIDETESESSNSDEEEEEGGNNKENILTETDDKIIL